MSVLLCGKSRNNNATTFSMASLIPVCRDALPHFLLNYGFDSTTTYIFANNIDSSSGKPDS